MDEQDPKECGPLTGLALQIRGLLHHRLLAAFLRIPLVFAVFLIQIAFCVVRLLKTDPGDLSELALTIADLTALVCLSILYRATTTFMVKYDKLLKRAWPFMVALEKNTTPVLTRQTTRWLNFWKAMTATIVLTHCCSIIPLLTVPVFTGDTYFRTWPPSTNNKWLFWAKHVLQSYVTVQGVVSLLIFHSSHTASVGGLKVMFQVLNIHIRGIQAGPLVSFQIKTFARIHSELTRLCVESNAVFQKYIRTVIYGATIMSTLTALLVLVREPNIHNIALGFVAPATYYSLCLLGEQLNQVNEELSEAIYFCDWLSLPVKERKMLFLMTTRAARPQAIVVPYMRPLTKAFFISTMANWYNAVTTMRHVIQSVSSKGNEGTT